MTTSAVFATLAAGTFILLCVVAWYLVQTLIQARQTALALETFLNATRPKVEEAVVRISSVVGRTDHFLESAEKRRGDGGGVFAMIVQALSGWLSGAQAVSTISTGIGAMLQAWSAISQARAAASNEATAGGSSHE